tara:strand:+ start:3122 stop:3820 length:699 start_codon:yes stop_codon:yes gene_type:complete
MKKKILAMIPARIGSQRLKKKNLALINNKPLISYAISAAKRAKIFHKIYINSDSKIFKKIALKNKIYFYLRPKVFGSSNTRSDDVVNDFIKKHDCDILAWINPIAPLQTDYEIKKVIKFFEKKKLNSLITTNNFKNHAIFKKKNLNFKKKERFAKTQNLKPVELMVYSIMMWKKDSFIKSYKINKSAILHGKIGYFPVSKLSGLIVKDKTDLQIVSTIMKTNKKKIKVKYFK